MFEGRRQPLLSRAAFFRRLMWGGVAGLAILLASLGLGMIGYHVFEKLSWLDAFANPAMILSGMGPLVPLQTGAGKVFAGCYALFSGVAFLTTIGLFFAPILHRFLHKFHLQTEAAEQRESRRDSRK